MTARSIGPLGLAGRQSSHRVPWQIRILPPFLSRKHLPSRLAKLRELEGMTPVLIRGQGTEFDSLREYVIGDDVRSIDWRATARRADVVVRTWRPERDRRVVIVLDTGRTSAGRVGVDPTASDPSGWPRLDWSMDAALLLAALASRAGDHVDFLAHDRVTRAGVFNASRTELLAHLVAAMAPLEPALVESDARRDGRRGPAPRPAAGAGGAAHRPERVGARRGPDGGAAAAVGQASGAARRGGRSPGGTPGGGPRRCRRGVRRRRGRTGAQRPARRSRRGCGMRASTSSTRRRKNWPRHWPTTTWR